LPDVIDLYTLQNKTRHDALFYAFYVFFNKLGVGLALAASQVALQLGGYESGVCSQPERVEETLRYLVVPGPVVLTLMALVCLYFYPIDEDLRMRVRKRIEENDKEYSQKSALGQDSKSYDSIRPITSQI